MHARPSCTKIVIYIRYCSLSAPRTLCGVLRRNASIALNGLDDSQQPRRGSSSEPAGSIIIINANRPFIPHPLSFLTEKYRRKRDAIAHSSKVLFRDKCSGERPRRSGTRVFRNTTADDTDSTVRYMRRLGFANFVRIYEDSKITLRWSGVRVTLKIRNPKFEAYIKYRL